MKKLLILNLLILMFQYSEAQSLIGKWKINTLITKAETEEYILFPNNEGKLGFYGNNLFINSDGTFTSSYGAPCGNDCFTTTVGKYEFKDNTHIRFHLEKITRQGECIGSSEPNLDLGLFYIHNDKDKTRLIKSNGNIQQDKMKISYWDLCDSVYEETKKYENIISWEWLPPNNFDRNSLNDVIAFYMNKHNIKSYEILYSRVSSDNRFIIAIVDIEHKINAILQPIGYGQVGLYSNDIINDINKTINEINNSKKLKVVNRKNLYDEKANSNTTINAFYKKKQILKFIHKEDFTNESSIITTIYFQNENPIYFEVKKIIKQNEIETFSTIVFYVRDWSNNNIIIKEVQNNAGEIRFSDRSNDKFRQLVEMSKKYK